MLNDEAIDLVEISGGNYEAPKMMVNDDGSTREGYFLEYASIARERCKAPIMITGGFRTASVMNEALRSNALDVIGLGRPLTLMPDLPNDMFEHKSEGCPLVPKSMGPKSLNYFAEGGYYLAQMSEMAQGREPIPDLDMWSAVWKFVSHQISMRKAISIRQTRPGGS